MRNLLMFMVILMSLCGSVIASLQDGLIVYYPFDEISGNAVSDDSGNNHNAKLMGGAEWASAEGRYRGAISLDGNDSCIVDENGADYINGLTAFTMSVWIKATETNHDRGFLMGIDPDDSDSIFGLRYDKDSWDVKGSVDVIKASLTTTGGKQTYESQSNMQTTEWQHITYSWESGKQLSLYIDGILDDNATHNSDATEGKVSNVVKLIIGKGAKDTSSSWLGLIDDFRLYNRVLTEEEITRIAGGVLSVELHDKLATTWGTLKIE